jgi:hypothetical protein
MLDIQLDRPASGIYFRPAKAVDATFPMRGSPSTFGGGMHAELVRDNISGSAATQQHDRTAGVAEVWVG